jgi:hypothetical protein
VIRRISAYYFTFWLLYSSTSYHDCSTLQVCGFRGNASGYAAKEFVANNVGQGEVLIITEEPVVA